MAYIIKNTSGLISTRLTDVGRRKLSQGNFLISYFQIGDSEVSYSAATPYNQVRNNILMPSFNAQNDTGYPQSNKEEVKYPYYVQSGSGIKYGIPFMDSGYDIVYNTQGPKGFFSASTATTIVQTSSAYTVTSNYFVDMTTLSGQTDIFLDFDYCAATSGTPRVGDFITIYYDGVGNCNSVNTVPILTYKIVGLNPTTGTTAQTPWHVYLDRPVPNYTATTTAGNYARAQIYPSGMTVLYDSEVPQIYWDPTTLNFDEPCSILNKETPVWNMNIPWSENPAGLFPSTYQDYSTYSAVTYLGSKEYFGYQESSGQTFFVSNRFSAETTDTYYYNSFDEQVKVLPKNQKAIAIVHFTNQDIDFPYGEKFATLPFDPQNPTNQTGLARHLKVKLPTLMWHKSTGNTIGQTFMIDPPNYNLCVPHYMKSSKNPDMNDPGLRYFQLWDLNPDSNGNLNRVGKVFPDSQTIIFDDEEIVAAMSYKANRNWTLPAPRLSTVPPNLCDSNQTGTPLFTNPSERLWLTYLFTNTGFTNSLHCNYYSQVIAPSGTSVTNPYNVITKFGSEFPFMSQNYGPIPLSGFTGFVANNLILLVQRVTGDTKPSSTSWRKIDVTNSMSANTINGYLTMSGMTGTTFQIDGDMYNAASSNLYNLANYINIPLWGATGQTLNFGGEYYFYGNFETDISATIYEMRYKVTLGRNQFTNTTNPTWQSGTTSYITEIGLFDEDYDLLVLSKLQSPQIRQGIQQFSVKLDF